MSAWSGILIEARFPTQAPLWGGSRLNPVGNLLHQGAGGRSNPSSSPQEAQPTFQGTAGDNAWKKPMRVTEPIFLFPLSRHHAQGCEKEAEIPF